MNCRLTSIKKSYLAPTGSRANPIFTRRGGQGDSINSSIKPLQDAFWHSEAATFIGLIPIPIQNCEFAACLSFGKTGSFSLCAVQF